LQQSPEIARVPIRTIAFRTLPGAASHPIAGRTWAEEAKWAITSLRIRACLAANESPEMRQGNAENAGLKREGLADSASRRHSVRHKYTKYYAVPAQDRFQAADCGAFAVPNVFVVTLELRHVVYRPSYEKV